MNVVEARRILGVQAGDSLVYIRGRYRKLAKLYHPDMPTGDAKAFKDLQEAYEYLTQPHEEPAQQSTTTTLMRMSVPVGATEVEIKVDMWGNVHVEWYGVIYGNGVAIMKEGHLWQR